MIGVIVAAHGKLAEALIEAALLVVPDADPVQAVSINKNDDSNAIESRLRQAISELTSYQAVLILTDMFGGSPSNIGLTLHQPGKVEVLTGANLPMLIRALQQCHRDIALDEAAREVKDYGARAIAIASEVLGLSANEEKST
ncbi:MAG: PTS sugar transporter subunit IIA [Deltaproteobacteria bacterium]|nr:PTS sugar transporter subunit IIA [Deltaproteobacteria bacterium]